MPVFATPVRLRDVIFSEMPKLSHRRRTIAAVLLVLAFLTPTLAFFQFQNSAGERIEWTGIDIFTFIQGEPSKPFPPLDKWVERTPSRVLAPAFLPLVGATYLLLAVCAVGVAFSLLRKLLRLAAVPAGIAALGALDAARFPFAGFTSHVRPAEGSYALAALAVLLSIVPFMQSLDQ